MAAPYTVAEHDGVEPSTAAVAPVFQAGRRTRGGVLDYSHIAAKRMDERGGIAPLTARP
jgi:hypothetical protein